ncbi:MAG: hypothetical protein HPM95_15430 [Alphaproteobacteria bacterium]|nr:hypothetical protein [Alphaproteobacteria bacterium]
MAAGTISLAQARGAGDRHGRRHQWPPPYWPPSAGRRRQPDGGRPCGLQRDDGGDGFALLTPFAALGPHIVAALGDEQLALVAFTPPSTSSASW